MEAYSITFDGRVLNRGFWLYVIAIDTPVGLLLYVGRTGDNSSANAASPFARIGQHLDLRANAKGNALTRNLRSVSIEPSTCTMEMIAIGPLFPEEKSFEAHRSIRDRVAALERALAARLKQQGHSVLGEHSSRVAVDENLLAEAAMLIEARLRNRQPANKPLQATSGRPVGVE